MLTKAHGGEQISSASGRVLAGSGERRALLRIATGKALPSRYARRRARSWVFDSCGGQSVMPLVQYLLSCVRTPVYQPRLNILSKPAIAIAYLLAVNAFFRGNTPQRRHLSPHRLPRRLPRRAHRLPARKTFLRPTSPRTEVALCLDRSVRRGIRRRSRAARCCLPSTAAAAMARTCAAAIWAARICCARRSL